jgi:hypothetical protein
MKRTALWSGIILLLCILLSLPLALWRISESHRYMLRVIGDNTFVFDTRTGDLTRLPHGGGWYLVTHLNGKVEIRQGSLVNRMPRKTTPSSFVPDVPGPPK